VSAAFCLVKSASLTGTSPKAIPWFVSDVLPFDFAWTIDSLLDPPFFTTHAGSPLATEELQTLSSLADRWKSHLSTGNWALSVPLDLPLGTGQSDPLVNYWTTGWSYQDMPVKAPRLVEELAKSDLVVFKGDLNYRK